jgi:phosphohistidine phosphatase
MKLYFLRHGLAGDRATWQGADCDRPLTDEGKEKMARTADTLAALDLALDAIVTSPLVRAHQTAEIVARKLNGVQLIKDDRLDPEFDSRRLAKILADHSTASELMLVGHEPGFSMTIGELIGGGRVECKKGGVACVKLDAPFLRGELVWLAPPKILAR